MRIARVAIAASEFTTSVGVDSPAEGNTLGVALVQDGLDWEQKVFRPALGFGSGGGCGEARNADQFRRGLLTPGRYRRGRGSTAQALTIAVANGLGK